MSRHFEGLSRSYLHRLIENGTVRVGGKPVKKGHMLRAGDVVQVGAFLLPTERAIAPNPALPFPVVHAARDYVVVDKPPAMPTHPNDFDDASTLANAALARHPEIATVGDDPLRPGIVHRLDGDTSGLIVVALTPLGFAHFRGLFDRREMKKAYLALVLGEVRAAGKIARPLAHHPRNPRKMVVVEPGKSHRSKAREASTEYEPVEAFVGYTLVRARTLTGRMHQVRVHLAGAGYPLCGDALYQEGHHRQKDRSGSPRHFLHASELAFTDPEGRAVRLTSEPPADLAAVLAKLRRLGAG